MFVVLLRGLSTMTSIARPARGGYRICCEARLTLLRRTPLLDKGVNVEAIQMFIPTTGINKCGKNSGQSNH